MPKFKIVPSTIFALTLVALTAASVFAQRARSARTATSSDLGRAATQQQQTETRNQTASPWTEFLASNGEIAVSFPSAMQERAPDSKSIYAHYVANFKKMQFGLILQNMRESKLPPAAYNRFSSDGEKMYLQMLREEDGWRIVSHRFLAINQTEMEAWHPLEGNGNFLHQISRMIRKNGWQYNITCGALVPNQEVNRDLCRQYFESVRLVQNAQPPSGWYKFTAPGKDFSLLSPAALRLRPDEDSSNSVKVTHYDGAANDHYFGVNFFDNGAASNETLFNQFENGYEDNMVAMYKNKGWQVVKSQKSAKNEAEFEVWMPTRNPNWALHSLIRNIVYRGRIYSTVCGSSLYNQTVDRDLCRRYFDSFQVSP